MSVTGIFSQRRHFQGLLAYKTSALALLAGVCVFREEQLGPMQHVHQN